MSSIAVMQVAVANEGEAHRLRRQLAEAWAEIKTLRRTVAHQARLLENLESETSPSAPSVNCVYWLFAETRWHEPSWRNHWNRLKPFVDGLGTLAACDVTPLVWERHRSARRRQVDWRGGTPCEHTLNIELARAKTMLDWAVETNMIKFNPLKAGKYVKTISRRETRLTQQDLTTLLEQAEDLRDGRLLDGDDDGSRAAMLTAFMLCCFDSMLRFNEARNLRRDLIASDGTYRLAAVTTKGKRPRAVVLTPRTLEAIAAVPRDPANNLVFSRNGVLVGEQTLRAWFRWACEKSNVNARVVGKEKRIVPHHLRHAGASEADEAGVPATALRDTLGHAEMSTTERYLHREQEESARIVAERMAEAAEKGRRPPRRAKKR